MNLLKPPRTFEFVVKELADGLRNRTIALSEDMRQTTADVEALYQRIPSNWGMSRQEFEHLLRHPPVTQSADLHSNQPDLGKRVIISQGLMIRGEITGTEPLFIDGNIEGSIDLSGERVTINSNAQVNANITAHDIIVLGRVRGNLFASGRVDLRAGGSLNGDISAVRISIEDGAYFMGGIHLRKPGEKSSNFYVTRGAGDAVNAEEWHAALRRA
jgi:cytoskeletal protein CcmA (bactofilin family)